MSINSGQNPAQNIIDAEITRIDEKGQSLNNIQFGKQRALDLNKNFEDRTTAFNQIFIIIFSTLALIILLIFLKKTVYGIEDFINISIFIISILGFGYSMILWIDFYRRDPSDFNKIMYIPPGTLSADQASLNASMNGGGIPSGGTGIGDGYGIGVVKDNGQSFPPGSENQSFQLVNIFGQLIDSNGMVITNQNITKNSQEQLINIFGQLVNSQGRLVNSQGQLINNKGQRINSQGYLIDDNDNELPNQPRIKNGLPVIGSDGHYINNTTDESMPGTPPPPTLPTIIPVIPPNGPPPILDPITLEPIPKFPSDEPITLNNPGEEKPPIYTSGIVPIINTTSAPITTQPDTPTPRKNQYQETDDDDYGDDYGDDESPIPSEEVLSTIFNNDPMVDLHLSSNNVPKLITNEIFLASNNRDTILVKDLKTFYFFNLNLSKDIFKSYDGIHFININNQNILAQVIIDGPKSLYGATIDGKGIVVLNMRDNVKEYYYFYPSKYPATLQSDDIFLGPNGTSTIQVINKNSFKLQTVVDKNSINTNTVNILRSYTSIDGYLFIDNNNDLNEAKIVMEGPKEKTLDKSIYGQSILLYNNETGENSYYYYDRNLTENKPKSIADLTYYSTPRPTAYTTTYQSATSLLPITTTYPSDTSLLPIATTYSNINPLVTTPGTVFFTSPVSTRTPDIYIPQTTISTTPFQYSSILSQTSTTPFQTSTTFTTSISPSTLITTITTPYITTTAKPLLFPELKIIVYYPFVQNLKNYVYGKNNEIQDTDSFGGANVNITSTGSGSLTLDASKQQYLKMNSNSPVVTNSFISNNDGMSFACWILTSNPSNNTNTNSRIFDFGSELESQDNIMMYINNSNSIGCTVYSNTNKSSIEHTNTVNNYWHHVIFTMTYAPDKNSTWTIYLDGIAVQRTLGNYYPRQVARENSCLGKSSNSNSFYFNGKIDDFRIYQRVMTDYHISQVFLGKDKIITYFGFRINTEKSSPGTITTTPTPTTTTPTPTTTTPTPTTTTPTPTTTTPTPTPTTTTPTPTTTTPTPTTTTPTPTTTTPRPTTTTPRPTTTTPRPTTTTPRPTTTTPTPTTTTPRPTTTTPTPTTTTPRPTTTTPKPIVFDSSLVDTSKTTCAFAVKQYDPNTTLIIITGSGSLYFKYKVNTCSFALIGGGGGGGSYTMSNAGGGGGGGGLGRADMNGTLLNQVVVNIGFGGNSQSGNGGQTSVVFKDANGSEYGTVIAYGGGYGGWGDQSGYGGGNGGGSGSSKSGTNAGDVILTRYTGNVFANKYTNGYSGGLGQRNENNQGAGGGGGGCNGGGGAGNGYGGGGGAGLLWYNQQFGGGGGGGAGSWGGSTNGGLGGSGGGNGGSSFNGNGGNGTTYGAGGGGASNDRGMGGMGANGVVILAIKNLNFIINQ